MSLFGGYGFLGLGGTGVGNFAENTLGVIEQGANFVSSLPKNIIDIGVNLQEDIEGVSNAVGESVDKGTEGAYDDAVAVRGAKYGSALAEFINKNMQTIIFSALALVGFLFIKK